MLMKMERSRTKGTNVQRLNRMPKNIEHGRSTGMKNTVNCTPKHKT